MATLGLSETEKAAVEEFRRDVVEPSRTSLVVVDFWAEWCGPCKLIAPSLDELAPEYAGKLKVTKLNIDENAATPRKYGIKGIPTLQIFKGGSMEAQKVGAVPKSQLKAFIDSVL